jgi:hypothetical protein
LDVPWLDVGQAQSIEPGAAQIGILHCSCARGTRACASVCLKDAAIILWGAMPDSRVSIAQSAWVSVERVAGNVRHRDADCLTPKISPLL